MDNNTQQYQAPWERPDVAMVVSIFGGKVTNIKQIDKIKMEAIETYDRREI